MHVQRHLVSGATLAPGEALVSADGRARAVLGADGTLEVSLDGAFAWSSSTHASAPQAGVTRLALEPDGSLIVRVTRADDERPTILWSSSAAADEHALAAAGGICHVELRNDGAILVRLGAPDAAGDILWSSRGDVARATLAPGQCLGAGAWLVSSAGNHIAVQEPDGRLCVYRGAHPDARGDLVWASHAPSHAHHGAHDQGHHTRLLSGPEPRLAIVAGPAPTTRHVPSDADTRWLSPAAAATHRGGATGPGFLVLGNDGRLALRAGTAQRPGRVLWQSGPAVAANIEHVVFIMLENRGFDSALGYLYTRAAPPAHTIPSGLLPPFDGPDFTPQPTQLPFMLKGQAVTGPPTAGVSAANNPGTDPGEPYFNTLNQVFSATSEPPYGTAPTMNGFVRDFGEEIVDRPWIKSITPGNVLDIMRLFTPGDLPVMNTLAGGYATCDRWFSSVPTQTNANRAYSLCGTSIGLVDNGFYPGGFVSWLLQNDVFDTRTLWNVLHDHGRDTLDDWMVFYNEDYPAGLPDARPYTWNAFPQLQAIPGAWSHFATIDKFLSNARAGTLPRFSYIEPKWGGELIVGGKSVAYIDGNEYHPPEDVTHSEVMLKQIYDALRANGDAWQKTALVLCFDEQGGTYDHAPPPWGARPPWSSPPPFPRQYGFRFDRFGVRVPAMVISPWVDAGTIFRSATGVPFDHTSVIASVLEWLGIDPSNPDDPTSYLGERVAHAPRIWDALTRTSPRNDDPFDKPLPKLGDPVVYGLPLALKNAGTGEHLASADLAYAPIAAARRWFPTLDKDPARRVTLTLRDGYGPVSSGMSAQLRTSEMRINGLDSGMDRPQNTLGSWKDSSDVYYWFTDAWDTFGDQQSWALVAVDKPSGAPLVYGDKVTLAVATNLVSSPFLKPAGFPNGGYLTTGKKDSSAVWVLMPPLTQATPSSSR